MDENEIVDLSSLSGRLSDFSIDRSMLEGDEGPTNTTTDNATANTTATEEVVEPGRVSATATAEGDATEVVANPAEPTTTTTTTAEVPPVIASNDVVDPRIAIYEAYLPYIEELKAIGSPEDVRRVIAERDQRALASREQTIEEQRIAEIEQAVADSEISREFADKLIARDKPLYRLEAHQPLFEAQQRQQQEQVRQEAITKSVTALKGHYSEMDEEPVILAIDAGKESDEIIAIAERSHKRNVARIEAAEAKAIAAFGKTRSAIPAVDQGRGGTVATGVIPDPSDPVKFQAYLDSLDKQFKANDTYQ